MLSGTVPCLGQRETFLQRHERYVRLGRYARRHVPVFAQAPMIWNAVYLLLGEDGSIFSPS